MGTLMKCGHSATAVMPDGKPVCPICYGLTEHATEPLAAPDLAGREAKCSDCGMVRHSELTLPFFRYEPGRPFDSYYNGCKGWD